MKNLRHVAVAAAIALVAVATAAWAIQPGTTGTEKRFQEQALRSGVLTQVNKTATATAASATAGAATLNSAGSGVITTNALTTIAGSDYLLTLTNNMIAAADIVLAAADLGTATQGVLSVKTITPAAGSVTIVVRNLSGNNQNPLNGTINIRFLVIKQSALGSD